MSDKRRFFRTIYGGGKVMSPNYETVYSDLEPLDELNRLIELLPWLEEQKRIFDAPHAPAPAAPATEAFRKAADVEDSCPVFIGSQNAESPAAEPQGIANEPSIEEVTADLEALRAGPPQEPRPMTCEELLEMSNKADERDAAVQRADKLEDELNEAVMEKSNALAEIERLKVELRDADILWRDGKAQVAALTAERDAMLPEAAAAQRMREAIGKLPKVRQPTNHPDSSWEWEGLRWEEWQIQRAIHYCCAAAAPGAGNPSPAVARAFETYKRGQALADENKRLFDKLSDAEIALAKAEAAVSRVLKLKQNWQQSANAVYREFGHKLEAALAKLRGDK